MRLFPFAVALFTTAAIAAPSSRSLDRGPGLPGERAGGVTTYAVSDFDKIAFGLPGAIEVRVGPAWSVRATGPAAAFANLRVVRDRGLLQIGHRYDNRADDPAERLLRFTVTVPRLSAVALGGSGRMAVDRVTGPALDAALGGSGSLSLGAVDVERAEISIGGSGDVTVQGSARSLRADLGGSGNLRAAGLHARSAQVSSAGSGTIRATVDGPATVSTVGSGSIDLGPGARCAISRMGKATVRCGS